MSEAQFDALLAVLSVGYSPATKQAIALQREFDRWRERHGLNPSGRQAERLRRWGRLAARASGMVAGAEEAGGR